jgi:putrescine transport system permease protein
MIKRTDSALTASRLSESAKMTSRRHWVRVVDDFFQSRWKGFSVAIPYVWLVIFFLIPFFIVLKISFAESLIASPPFSSLFEWSEDAALRMTLIFDNFSYLWEDDLYVKTYLNSVKISTISTILCLLIGYPMAYAIVRASGTMKYLLLLMVILPFWTSYGEARCLWRGIP